VGADINVWMWIAGQLIVGAAIWGGIRADIRSMHVTMEHLEKTANDAHVRIDRILERARDGH
jgi:hypothetical protein